jgi:hypothetical protein
MISHGINSASMAAIGAACSAIKPDSGYRGTYAFGTRVRPDRIFARRWRCLRQRTHAQIIPFGVAPMVMSTACHDVLKGGIAPFPSTRQMTHCG